MKTSRTYELAHVPQKPGIFCYFPVSFIFTFPLAGPIPAELGNLAALEFLYLYGNELCGKRRGKCITTAFDDKEECRERRVGQWVVPRRG